MTYDLYAVAVLIATLLIVFLGWEKITGKPKDADQTGEHEQLPAVPRFVRGPQVRSVPLEPQPSALPIRLRGHATTHDEESFPF